MHISPKGQLFAFLSHLIDDRDLGKVWTDGVALVNKGVGLSNGPDVTACLWSSFDEGRGALGTPVRESDTDSVELVGAADIVAEVLRTSSVEKGMKDLPQTYFAAGVSE